MAEFIRLGYNVSAPYGDCEHYDFIADVDGRLIRVQCKTPTQYSDETRIELDVRKKKYQYRGVRGSLVYSNDDLDYFATYYKGQAYLIPVGDCYSKKRLRLVPSKNGHDERYSFAEWYEMERVIKNILEEANK